MCIYAICDLLRLFCRCMYLQKLVNGVRLLDNLEYSAQIPINQVIRELPVIN